MTGESLNIAQDQLEKLKQLFPETITEGKIDWEKLQATLGKENIEFLNERYVLNWAGKAEAFKVLQQPTTATLKPCPGEGINDGFDSHHTGEGLGEVSENVFIEGENLEVLKVLQKAYYGKVKCIIIDPPYNTGNDSFIYPDSFKESKEAYQKRIGEIDEEGFLMKEGLFRKNSKDSGRYHSNWLSMMYPRLFLAKNLLRDDGVIFVHIDDNEVHNLRMTMNEIFGEENFVAQIVWQKKTGAGAKTKGFITLHEYVLCYAKNFSQDWDIEIPYSDKTRTMYNKRDEHFEKLGPYATWPLDTTSMDERKNLRYPLIYNGKEIWPKKQWLWSKDKAEKAQKENKLVFNLKEAEGQYSVRFKGYLYDEEGNERRGKPLSVTIGPYTQEGTKDFEGVFNERDIFPFPKPVSFVKQLINIFINGKLTNEDLFLDFFAGSGTTAQAALELNKEDGGNRKFILVQLPELCDESSEAFKAGYKTIADISKERIRRVINRLNHGFDGLKDGADNVDKKEAQQKLFEAEEKNQHNPGISVISDSDIGFKVFKLSSSNFKIWRGNEITGDNLEQQLEIFTDPVREGSETENMLYELMLKAGYLLTDKVERVIATQNETKGKQSLNSVYYAINDGELIIVLEAMNQALIETIISAKPKKVIALDTLFEDNDQLKTNTVLQMKDAEIDFKTI
jgi:adenine-specific DNA-methyltransferase